MQFETLLLDNTEHLSTITLNRPEKRNAITTQMIADLQSALDAIEKTNTRVVIITGTGKAFCAGIDLELLQAIAQQTPAENQDDSRRIAKMFRKIWSYSRPMIAAALRLHAVGAGSQVRLHRSEDRILARDCLRLPLPPDRRKTLPRSSANGPAGRSLGSKGTRSGQRNCILGKTGGPRARTCRRSASRQPQQHHPCQASARFRSRCRRRS